MKIIDFHAHIYPDKIAERAVAGVGDFYNLEMKCNGTLSQLMDSGEKYGVSRYVVHSVATSPEQVPAINRFIASQVEAHSDKLVGFGTLHQDLQNPEEEIDLAIFMGLKGIKLHPDTQKFNMDDPKMMDVYEIIQSKNLPILFHCGDYRYDYSHPRRLAKILDTFPNLTVIAAHFGGWSVFDLAIEHLKDRRCYLDTSSSFAMLGKTRSKEIIRIYGAERILFGTDFPMSNYDYEINHIRDFGLTEKEYEMIMHENAEKILGL
ncbi:MAG: amidohydrolase family protein [Bacillota bacterium]|nr:amidohydrolase family protein [Bacillota bacterium]